MLPCLRYLHEHENSFCPVSRTLYVHHGHRHPPPDAEYRVNRQFSGVDACRVRMMHAYTEHRYQSCLTKGLTGTAAMRGVNLSLHSGTPR